LVVGSDISCAVGNGYHGGMNIRGLGVGHPNGMTCGLNDGPLSGFPLGEFPPCESSSCPPFSVGEYNFFLVHELTNHYSIQFT
jgi:hypothetical protein